jgi:predicted  nucleic acid-binding Zn-ribbon protein
MQVENSREYEAMLREVDSMERQNQNREEERTALQEERDIQEENLHNVEETWNELKSSLKIKSKTWKNALPLAQEKLHDLENERASVSTGIPGPVLRRYEFIRNRLRHPVIVPVEDGVCTGCHIAIPPQVFIDLQRGTHILSCPNCQRLIYWAHHFQDVKAENETQEEPSAE